MLHPDGSTSRAASSRRTASSSVKVLVDPAGPHAQDVAVPQAIPAVEQRRLEVGDRERTRRERVVAAARRQVDQHAPADDAPARPVLDAERHRVGVRLPCQPP